MKNAAIYFGNALPPEQFRDEEIRNRTLKEGLEVISGIPGVNVRQQLTYVCAAIVSVTEESIQNIQRVLAETQKGTMTVDNLDEPMFFSANE